MYKGSKPIERGILSLSMYLSLFDYLTCMFDIVDVLPLAERVAVRAPARARPLADVHQEPVSV